MDGLIILGYLQIRGVKLKTSKEELLNIAAELFSQKGYSFTLSDLAEKASIKPPSIYNHFHNKDEIVEQIVAREIETYYTSTTNKFNSLKELSDLSFRQVLELSYWHALEYFDDIQTLKFWKNINLITNEALIEKFDTIKRNEETKHFNLLLDAFKTASQKKEIKDCFHEERVFLFGAMIYGLISRILSFKQLSIVREFAKNTFIAFWNGIAL